MGRARKEKKRLMSLAERRQRELAWMLYITEGYIGNVKHALAVNAYTLDFAALAIMGKAAASAEEVAADLRAAMQPQV